MVRFILRPAVFRIEGCWISEIYRMTSDWLWNHNSQMYPKVQIWVRSALRPVLFEIQVCRNSEMHRWTSNWHWTLKFHSYPPYTISPWCPNFGPFGSSASRFQDIAHFTIDYHIKRQKGKHSKFEISQFFNNFGRDPPQEYAWIWGSDLVYILSEEMSFEIFSTI